MKRLLKYIKSFSLGIQNSMEYRADFLLNIFSTVFSLFVQFFFWTAIFHNTKSLTVYGYKYDQLIIYTVMAGLVSKLVSTGFERDISNDIKTGGLNKFLVQPINYFFYRISCFVGQKVCQLLFITLLSALILAVCKMFLNFSIKFESITYAIIPIVLSIILNFLISYSISSLAFWMTEVGMLFWGINLLTLVLSGAIFPLDIFGNNILRFFNILPFKYTTYFSINILTGKIENNSIIFGVTIQLVWIIIFAVLSKLMWKFGTQKYIAVGG
jgi:ABC-2 type transport system permease protein